MCTKMVQVLWGCFLLWNLYISSAQTIYPGIKARATQRALDYGIQAGVEMIEKMVKERNIPDLKGSESPKFLKIDYMNYKLINIKINAFSLPNTSLAFVPGVGIRALIKHGTANISTDWEIKSPLFQDTGGANLLLSGVYFTGIVVLARNDFGHPILKLQDCNAQVSHNDISFSGELSVLYNSFAEPMEKPILKNLNKMLCPIITSEVEALNANLSMLEVLRSVDNYTLLDYSLISSPEITENYIDLNLKGVFYPLENLTDPPFSSVPFVLPEHNDSMIYIGISEYFFKSASYAYFTAGAFNVTLTTKKIFNHLIHNSQGLGNMLSWVASTNVALAILGQRLICSLSLNRFRLSLPESIRSNIEVFRFENILSSILHFGVLPLANAKLQQGFPLPNPHKISLVNSDIEVLEGFLLISTDLKYKTSLKQQSSFHGWEALNLISGRWRGKPAPWLPVWSPLQEVNRP
ncbi:BPI fold-containing family C protein isoform X4 [Orcinus orca]|uniref:BPI fold-containing family C protein isoform X4 n=1 Tax=Orcinus orca TaxID=9733 RepID=UPI00144284A7|nr:BPI fold-containing family C protein isoform X4 [Orcinus orca]